MFRQYGIVIRFAAILIFIFSLKGCVFFPEKGKHLFILSGQSNMMALDLNLSFIPTIEREFGKENILIIKHAAAGEPISRWVKDWKSIKGDSALEGKRGDVYDALMEKTNFAIKNQKIATITLIWMQGESDALKRYGEVYGKSLKSLLNQFQQDLNRNDIYFVAGRISDYRNGGHWKLVRDEQIYMAESNFRYAWIDTDDLNDDIPREERIKWRKLYKTRRRVRNDLHYSEEGYVLLGQRFAESAINLINNN